MNKALLISVKPEFAEKIFNGIKTIELRKSAPNVKKGDLLIIYSTNPVKAIIGICHIAEIIKLSPSEMWQIHKDKLGIDKKRFDEYYGGCETAIGIKITSICLLNSEIKLSKIKKMFPKFHPPQTFKYYSKPYLFKTYFKIAS